MVEQRFCKAWVGGSIPLSGSMDDLKTTYNKIAGEWNKDHGNDTWWVEGVDQFVSLLKPGAAVLDLGCGAGVKSKYLSEKGLQVNGIDFAEKMIELARKNVPQAEFSVLDIHDLDNLGKTFDGILAQAVLLHIPKKEIQTIFEIIKRALRPNGYLYVAVKHVNPGEPEEEVRTEHDYGYEYSRFFSYFTVDELKKYFNMAGMTVCYERLNDPEPGKRAWIQVIGQKTA